MKTVKTQQEYEAYLLSQQAKQAFARASVVVEHLGRCINLVGDAFRAIQAVKLPPQPDD